MLFGVILIVGYIMEAWCLHLRNQIKIKPSAAMAKHDNVTVSSSERDESSAQSDGLVDWSHLHAAYGNCVSATANATLSQLRQLHTALTRLVRTHVASRDQTNLLQDTDAEIRKFVQFKNHA